MTSNDHGAAPCAARRRRPADCAAIYALDATLWRALAAIPLMEEGDSAFSDGKAYWLNATQVAHLVGPGALELRLTKAVIRELRASLKADPRVELRSSSSDWIVVRFAGEEDLVFVTALARRAAAVHAPAGGAVPKPPPAGADLARRRRFH